MTHTDVKLTPGQRTALDRLVERNVLSEEQRAAVLSALESQALDPEPRLRRPGHAAIWELFGYVGGALVLGAAVLLLWMSWDELGRSARVGLLIGASVALLGAGTFIGSGPTGVRALAAAGPSARARSVAVLYALGSGTLAIAVGNAVHVAEWPAAMLTGLVTALLGYAVLASTPGLLATGAFSVGVVLAAAGEWFSGSTLSITIGLLVLGAAWIAWAMTGRLIDDTVGIVGGAAIALVGAQWPVSSEQPWWGYGLTVVIALLCFVEYVRRRRSVILLGLGVLGISAAVPEAIWDWTEGSLGAPLVVLMVGLAFLVAAGIGFRLRQSMRSDSDESVP